MSYHANIMKKRSYIPGLLLAALLACGSVPQEKLRDADIIFQTSRSSQSLAIQKATRSPYSHMGILFIRSGKPYVFEAIATVQYTPLKKWIKRGAGGRYVVKRLRDADKILTPDALARLRAAAARFEAKPYDAAFEWTNSRIYCSELVWKIYDQALGLHIGALQKLRDFDLTGPVVQAKLKERYGKNIPWKEPVISPGAMFSCDRLVRVAGN